MKHARHTRSLLVIAALAVVAIVAQAGNGKPPHKPGDPSDGNGAPITARITVSDDPVGRPIASGFVGLSIEYRALMAYAGTNPNAPNPAFVQLVRNIAGPTPIIRIGGDSTDWSWWNPHGATRPPGIRYSITPRWVAVAGALARALNARLILGINLEANNPALAGAEARAFLAGIGRPWIKAFELGNEPEVYSGLPWYTTPDGFQVWGRPRDNYGLSSYIRDVKRLSSVLPVGVPLAGPTSGGQQWLNGLGRLLVATPRIRLATFHRYPLHRCYVRKHSPTTPTLAHLLNPVAASGPADSVARAVRIAHTHDVPFNVDELNSVSCSGAHGVSDAFASSLWMLDTLFHMARVGVDGVNIHTLPAAYYAPFSFTHNGGVWRATVKPEYYGLEMFADAAPAGARLLRVAQPDSDTVHVWATQTPDHTTRVVLINDSTRTAQNLALRAPSNNEAAAVQRLTAPSIASRRGITFQTAQPLTPTKGTYLVKVPPASAALLTIPAR